MIAWLTKNKDTAKAYVDRYGGPLKGAAQNVTPGAGRAPAEERLNERSLAIGEHIVGRLREMARRSDVLPIGDIP